MLKTCLVGLLGAMLIASAHAQVYQWRDAKGKLHFGDQPPPGVSAKLLRPGEQAGVAPADPDDETADPDTSPAPPAPPAREPEPAAEPDPDAAERDALEARTRAAEAAALAELERERSEAQARNCQLARNQLAALEAGQRIARFNEKGEREVLNDAQRAEEVARMRKFLGEACAQ